MKIDNIFQEIYFGNSVEKWLVAFGVFFVLVLVLFLHKKFLIKRFEHFKKAAGSSDNQIDDLLVEILSSISTPILLIASLYIASFFLHLNENIVSLRKSVIVTALFVQIALCFSGLISYYTNKLLEKIQDQEIGKTTQIKAVSFITRVVLWSVIAIIILNNLGFNITALIAGFGIGGIAVALAMQSLLGDIIASLSIILDKPFEVGDYIVIGDMKGNVESIGLKTTRIKSLSGEQLVFPNNDLIQSRIQNYKRMQERRIAFTLGVVYDTPYDKLTQIPSILKEIIDQHPDTAFRRAHFYSYGDFSLDFEVVYLVNSSSYDHYMNAQQGINLEIFRKFGSEGIKFAYPTQTIFVNKPSNESGYKN